MLFSSPTVTVYLCFLTAVFGLAMGSFLNCMAVRIVHKEPLTGRSYCPDCRHPLAAVDLVPVFSWLFLKGKCRYCKKTVSAWYPASELLTAAVFLSALFKYDVSLKTLEMLVLASILLCISFADLEAYLIPDGLIIAGIACRVLFILLSGDVWTNALTSLIGGISVSLPVLLIVLVMEKILKKEAMGGGDIKLLFMIGIYFDWKLNLTALFFACFIGIALALCLKKRAAQNGRQIPFGPALAAGAWLSMLFAQPLISWYLGLFI